jgi:hypothetical protein
MTIQLDWPPNVVTRLTEEARRKGMSLGDYLLQTVLQQAAPHTTSSPQEAAREAARAEAGRSIRELRAGNVLGPDLTIRDII